MRYLEPDLTVHNFKGVYQKYPQLQHGFLVVADCRRLVALCRNVILCDVESFPNRISKGNLVLSSAGFEYHSQGIRDRALVYVWRLVTPVWELLLGQIGAFLKSSAPQLSVEHKNSWIVYRYHWKIAFEESNLNTELENIISQIFTPKIERAVVVLL